jgi:hypothetical protein
MMIVPADPETWSAGQWASHLAATWGWSIFPVTIRRKPDGSKDVQPHGSWRKLSTRTPDVATLAQIDAAGAYGIDCGKSGVGVVDLDRHGGPDGVAEWQRRCGARSAAEFATASGGEHLVFAAPPADVPTRSYGTLGIDVRADGGFIIGPGSSVRGEPAARWQVSSLPQQPIVLPPFPAALLRAVAAEDAQQRGKVARDIDPAAFSEQLAATDATDVGECWRYLRQKLAMLAASVSGGFNDALNDVMHAAGRYAVTWAAAVHAAPPPVEVGQQWAAETLLSPLVTERRIDELDENDWRTIHSTGFAKGLTQPWQRGLRPEDMTMLAGWGVADPDPTPPTVPGVGAATASGDAAEDELFAFGTADEYATRSRHRRPCTARSGAVRPCSTRPGCIGCKASRSPASRGSRSSQLSNICVPGTPCCGSTTRTRGPT